ncbi:3' terminal RNA ribose 2'-O-methyltransferase Hen1 [Bacillus gobiensis]|uniref:methyltransferase domain-containing protein n=1 Tax=Bacillus gobiensis TaxID=1441095 RepID=UPI003D2270D3
MQLTIKASGENVKSISHLLAKNPNNIYERNHKGHLVRLFYSKFTETAIEVTIFVTPDPIELLRNNANAYDITHYINDREFAVSSIFISFIRKALGTALNGQPKEEYIKWVDHPFAFQFSFGPVSSSLSDQHIMDLFQPLGFEVEITRADTDYYFDFKSKSTARFISLKGYTTLQTGLRQLFVLIPVLDNYKHYFIDEKEIEKLERYGQGWLEDHPEKGFILRQFLRFKEIYSVIDNKTDTRKKNDEARTRLNDLRYEKIIEKINSMSHKQRIVDFGSGEGKLSYRLGFVNGVQEVLAVEPSETTSLRAVERFKKAENTDGFVSPEPVWGSLFYYDERLKSKDIMILCEVIEHIDEERLPKVMDTILQEYQPKALIITTPNKEYNAVYNMETHFRHNDHRFEWTRGEFRKWCTNRNQDEKYELSFDGIGEEHILYGSPTQMCVFVRKEGE